MYCIFQSDSFFCADSIFVATLSIIKAHTEVGNGIGICCCKLIITPFQYDGSAGGITDKQVEVYATRTFDVVLFGQGNSFFYCCTAVQNIACQHKVANSTFIRIVLVYSSFTLFDIQLEYGNSQAFFVDAIHKKIRQQHSQRGIRVSIIKRTGTYVTSSHGQPEGIGNA